MTTTATPVTEIDYKASALAALGSKFFPTVEKTIKDAMKGHMDHIERLEEYINKNVPDADLKAKILKTIDDRKQLANASGDAVKLQYARAMVEILSEAGIIVHVDEPKVRKVRGPQKDKAPAVPANADHVTKVRGFFSTDPSKAIGTTELATATGLTPADVKAAVMFLKSENALTIVGKGRGTKWYLSPATVVQTAAPAVAGATA